MRTKVWWSTSLFVAALAAQVGCSSTSSELGDVKPGRPLVGTLADGFQDTLVISGRTHPTAIRFAPNGQVFVAEKSGLLFAYDDVMNGPAVARQVIDLRTAVHDFWDRGLLGLAIHPNYPATPEVYVLYAHDVFADGTGPRWGDRCPDPPGATQHGCVVYGRLSRLVIDLATMVGTEVPLISNQWCHQYPSHSVGDLRFGPDGYLYVSGGEGASFTFADFGQDGNPCGDPPNAAGTPDSALATAEGGRLRSQDILSNGDPAGYGGSILRLDVSGPTVRIPADNPLVGKGTTDDDAIIAIGLRNPFRWTFRPGTRELWIGDVGDVTWEEVNRVVDPVAGVTNFGWPCYEGPDERPVFRGNTLCDRVFARNFPSFVSPMMVAPPYLSYNHGATFVPGETRCGTGTSSVTGLAFNNGTLYPEEFRNTLFVADGSRRCIWTVAAGADGLPDPAARAPFLELSAGTIVDLEMGPDGRLYYVDFDQGSIYRFDHAAGNQPPVARVMASATSGLPPLSVTLDASASSDAEDGATLSYAWDLDGDGAFDDGTGAVIAHAFTRSGVTVVSVRVTDTRGASAVAQVSIDVGNTPPVPVIASPAASATWAVGDAIAFNGSATDAEDGTLPASALSWELIMHHCRSEAMTDCHTHTVMTVRGTSEGSFVAPDHEWPSFLEIRLTAFDSGSGWFDPAWPFRRALVVDGAQGTMLTDVPVLVTLTPARIDYAKVQAGGRDLRFTDASGAVLSHEIESWNPTGASQVWVRVPVLPAGSSTTIYAYYGNAAASDAEDAAGVWRNGYAGVWHLGASLADSSPNGRTGIGHATSPAAGAVGSGTAFDGVSSFVDLGTSAAFALSGELTIEAWAKLAAGEQAFPRILSNKSQWDAAGGFSFELNPAIAACTVLGSGADFARGSAPFGGQFHYYAATIAGATATLYADGSDATLDAAVSALAPSSTPLTIGREAGGNFFAGVIDEVRLSSVARSRDWVAAQHRSMTDQMIHYGAEEPSTALGQSVSVMLLPRTSQVSFGSEPAGLTLQVGGEVATTPSTRRFIVGSRQTVTAPSPQVLDGASYAFASWSDGQAATHLYTVPDGDSALTAVYSTAGTVTDTDGDGMPDSWETAHGLDPNDASDAAGDLDADRLTNLAEFQAGSDPTRADSDGDGWDDFTEVSFGGDPIDAAVVPSPPQVAIAAPAAGALLPGPSVSVIFSIGGMQRAGDRVGIALDGGSEMTATDAAGKVMFTAVAPGSHTLRAQVRDADGVAYTHAGATLTRSFTVGSVVCGTGRLTAVAATASSVESASLPATSVIDGSLATRWSSAFADPQSLVVDLGAVRHIARVVLRWEAAASADYDIDVADSASGPWATVHTDHAGDGGVDDITGLSASGRYVRMLSRRRTTQWGDSLFEVEVYGDANPACVPGPAVCGNSELGVTAATASSIENASFPASAAVDGNVATRWSSAFADPQSLVVDLGAPRHVSRVVLRWEAAASADYDIDVADAAAGPWTTVRSDHAGNGGVDDFAGLSVNTRFVRMFSRRRTTQWGASLFELDVFGDPSPACTP